MTEWQPIETAPNDYPVRLGRWRKSYHGDCGIEWSTDVGIAWKVRKGFFGNWRERVLWCDEYTHWQPLPPPKP